MEKQQLIGQREAASAYYKRLPNLEERASLGDDDDSITLSDRFLTDSVPSRLGVNVPLNSIPKLSQHNKSDLINNEFEGNP